MKSSDEAGSPAGRSKQPGDDTQFIFVGSPSDMATERRLVREVIETLANDDRLTRPIQPFLYEEDFDEFTAARGPQQDLQERLSRSNLLVCLFGERLGRPLPDDFVGAPGALDLQNLESPVVHPWPPANPADADRSIPLTGTVYEFLFARKTGKRVIVLLVGDESVLREGTPPEQRNFGHGRLYHQLRGSLARPPLEKGKAYAEQSQWLCRFIDEFALTRSRATLSLVRNHEELRRQLEKELRRTLGIPVEALTEAGKGLGSYGVEDAGHFHGRRDEVRSLLDWHRDALIDPTRSNLLIVDGLSGVGKSSFIRAGVGAALQKGRSDLDPHVLCIVRWPELLHDTESPFVVFGKQIAAAFKKSYGVELWSAADLARWQENPFAGVELLSRIQNLAANHEPPPRLFVAIDQFEQLLGQIERADAGQESSANWAPVLSVLRSVAEGSVGLALVALPDDWSLVLRTERRFQEVRAALNLDANTEQRSLSLPDPTRTEAIIRGFFQDRATPVRSDLVQHLISQIDELRDGTGSFMPLLSVVLTRLYDAWKRRGVLPDGQSPESADSSTGIAPQHPDGSSLLAGATSFASPPAWSISLDMKTFASDARLAGVIGELAEKAYGASKRGRAGGFSTDNALTATLRQLIWINATDQRRSLRSEVESAFDSAQLALLKSLAAARLAEQNAGRWRLIHEAIVDHWDRARTLHENERADAIVVAKLRKRAEAWADFGRPGKLLLGEEEEVGQGVGFTEVERIFGVWHEQLDAMTNAFLEESLYRGATADVRTDQKGNPRLYWIACSGVERLVHRYLALFPYDFNATRPETERTPLYAACFGARVSVVRALLDAGADPERVAGAKQTALQLAAWIGNVEATRVLLDRRVDATARLDDGARALDWAAQEGHAEIIRLLLEHDEDLLELPGFNDRTALIAAAANGYNGVVQFLLRQGANPMAQEKTGFHALEWAAAEGYVDVVQSIIEHDRAPIDLPGFGGRTALLAAAANGHVAVIRALLRNEANVAAPAGDRAHALELAAEHGHADVVDALISYAPGGVDLPGRGGRTALLAAAASGHAPVVRILLRARGNPRGALLAAAAKGHLAVVRVLLKHHADPDGGASDGQTGIATAIPAPTAAELALQGEHWEVLRELTQTNIPGSEMRRLRLLYLASALGKTAGVQLLLAAGASVELSSADQETALHVAARANRQEIVNLLLDNGAQVDARDAIGLTPLHHAAYAGHEAMVSLLLERHASPNAADHMGWTALHVAARAGNAEIAKRLIGAHANVEARSFSPPLTPLEAALEVSAEGVVEVLVRAGAEPVAAVSLPAAAEATISLSTTRLTADGSAFRDGDRLFGLGFVSSGAGTELLLRSVLHRDDNTCRGCGMRAQSHQTAVCVGPIPREVRHWATFCTFCAQCFQLDQIKRTQSATLVYLPEVEQAQLSHVARELLVACVTGRKNRDRSLRAVDLLRERGEEAVRRLGTEEPSVLADWLEEAVTHGERANLETKLHGIRLMPQSRLVVREGDLEFNRFPQIVAFWRSANGPCAGVKDGVLPWLSLLESQIPSLT
jgi:ankyrin repeat protein